MMLGIYLGSRNIALACLIMGSMLRGNVVTRNTICISLNVLREETLELFDEQLGQTQVEITISSLPDLPAGLKVMLHKDLPDEYFVAPESEDLVLPSAFLFQHELIAAATTGSARNVWLVLKRRRDKLVSDTSCSEFAHRAAVFEVKHVQPPANTGRRQAQEEFNSSAVQACSPMEHGVAECDLSSEGFQRKPGVGFSTGLDDMVKVSRKIQSLERCSVGAGNRGIIRGIFPNDIRDAVQYRNLSTSMGRPLLR